MNKVAQVLGRSNKVVQTTWSNFKKYGAIEVSRPPGNRLIHNAVIPTDPDVVSTVQNFVRERRQARKRTVAKDVQQFLKDNNFIDYDPTSNKSTQTALRAVQRFLKKLGYKRGKRKGSMYYHLASANRLARDKYLTTIMPMLTNHLISDSPKPCMVYTDESYIHKNYSRHQDSLHDPNDVLDLSVKQHHKGERYCFIGAIIDRGSEGSKFVCRDIFKGGKQTADYHGMFNTAYYTNWFQRLLDQLRDDGIENAVIMLDNAKYHKSKPSNTPKYKEKKAVLQHACTGYGIPYVAAETKAMLWEKLKAHVATHIKPIVVAMAEAEGHIVLFTPPHHSDLQPIELVWAIVKGEVGRQYDEATTIKLVHDRLITAFGNLTPSIIHGCIAKAESKAFELHRYVRSTDNDGESDASDSDTGSSSSSSDEDADDE